MAAGTARATTLEERVAVPQPGAVTLLHIADLHAQLTPAQLRQPGPAAHPLGEDGFEQLAARLGPLGGVAHLATLIAAVRGEAGERALLLDGGDGLQGSWGALRSQGEDVARVFAALGVAATTGHWEFTYGAERLHALAASGPRFLAQNVVDRDWNEPVFEHTVFFEPGGVRVAVIGQAYPYTPIANPARFTPDWAFGLRAEELSERVQAARAEGARLVVLLSHNGLALDRALAARVPGLDVILAAHTHDITPEPIREGRTLIVASGSQGAFLTRLDVTPGHDGITGFAHRLIPVLAREVPADPPMAALVAELRAPHAVQLTRVVGRTERALWRRGTLNGTMDEVILSALRREQDAPIALSPGFRWGTALPAASDITAEQVWEHTAITYPETWRRVMRGEALRALLEDVADNLFHPDPLARQGGDMVRASGIGFTLDAAAPRGGRVRDLRLADGTPVEAARSYPVAGWASVAEPAMGRPVWEAVFDELARGPVAPQPNPLIRLA